MKSSRGEVLVALAVCAVGLMLSVRAESISAPVQSTPAETNRTDQALVTQVMQLLRAGTDPSLVIGFVEQWPTPYLTSISDLTQLRQAGASPDLLKTFARRGAELRLQRSRSAPPSPNTSGAQPPSVLFYPVLIYRSPIDLTPTAEWAWGSGYIFSDALWWWANYYPYPYGYFGWGPVEPFPHFHRR